MTTTAIPQLNIHRNDQYIQIDKSYIQDRGDTAYIHIGNGFKTSYIALNLDEAIRVVDQLNALILERKRELGIGANYEDVVIAAPVETVEIRLRDAYVELPETTVALLQKIEYDEENDADGIPYGDREYHINDFLPSGIRCDGDWEFV